MSSSSRVTHCPSRRPPDDIYTMRPFRVQLLRGLSLELRLGVGDPLTIELVLPGPVAPPQLRQVDLDPVAVVAHGQDRPDGVPVAEVAVALDPVDRDAGTVVEVHLEPEPGV